MRSPRAYWRFIAEPWKAATFAAGAALITLVAPYTGDPTWDHVDGLFMSVFCYTTAPWVVATCTRGIGARSRRRSFTSRPARPTAPTLIGNAPASGVLP